MTLPDKTELALFSLFLESLQAFNKSLKIEPREPRWRGIRLHAKAALAAVQSHVPPQRMDPPMIFRGNDHSLRFQAFVRQLSRTPLVMQLKRKEADDLITLFESSENLTDPNNSEYLRLHMEAETRAKASSPSKKEHGDLVHYTKHQLSMAMVSNVVGGVHRGLKQIQAMADLSRGQDLVLRSQTAIHDPRDVKITFKDVLKRMHKSMVSSIEAEDQSQVSGFLEPLIMRFVARCLIARLLS